MFSLTAIRFVVKGSCDQLAKYVGLDLRVPLFSHGQLYVVLSRAISTGRIKAVLPPDSDGLSTANIVYPEVLLDKGMSPFIFSNSTLIVKC